MPKKLGVIGGMGPEATSYFYEEVIRHTDAARDQDHIDMVILSHASMPDRTQAILSGKDEALMAEMAMDTRALTMLGAANIAIPCNTSHYFYDRIQATTPVPIIHMPRESARQAAALMGGKGRIGIMGTDGTIRAGVYHKACLEAGLTPVVPGEEAQKQVMRLIYDDIKSGLPGNPERFEYAVKDLRGSGCDMIVLACTEISVFKRGYQVPAFCLDAMDVLVKEAILRSGASYK